MDTTRCNEQNTAETCTSVPVIKWEMLRNLMEYQDLSYPALARASGTPESTLRKMLQGVTKDPRISSMFPVVRALGASFDRLLGLAPARDFAKEDATYDVTLMDNMRQNVEAMQIRLDEKRQRISELTTELQVSNSECNRLRKMYNEKCIALSSAEAQLHSLKTDADGRNKTEIEQRTDIEDLKRILYKERDELRKVRMLGILSGIGLVVAMIIIIYLLWEMANPALGNFRY